MKRFIRWLARVFDVKLTLGGIITGPVVIDGDVEVRGRLFVSGHLYCTGSITTEEGFGVVQSGSNWRGEARHRGLSVEVSAVKPKEQKI